MEVFLGVDSGTTTTLVARAIETEREKVRVEVLPIAQADGRGGELPDIKYLPSIAYFPASGPPLVGKAAEVRGPEEDVSRLVRAVKRHMGRRLLLPVVAKEPREVSALYLEKALREGRRSFPGADPVFTITVPASFTTNQRADTLVALRRACEAAKIRYPEDDEGQLFISEPVAAALAFLEQEFARPMEVRRLDLSRRNRVLVYDIGGGTLDLTLVFVEPQSQPVESLADVRIHVENIGYYNPFGGEDFDRALAQSFHRRLLEEHEEVGDLELTSDERMGVRLQLMNLAKTTKEQLSEQTEEEASLAFLEPEEEATQYYQGEIRVRTTQYSVEGEITAAEYRATVDHLLKGDSRKSLLTPLKDLLAKMGFQPAQLDGLLIVGGMAQLQLVVDTVRDFWGNRDKVWVFAPPDHAVVTGAAVYSYLRRRYPGYILQEPAADAYYVRLKDRFDLVILPAREKDGGKKRYKLANDADDLPLQIFAGEDSPGGDITDEVLVTLIHQGGTTIPLGRTYKSGTPIWVQMSYLGESAEEDHSKVPWVSVWVGDSESKPLFRRRYSDMIKEEHHA